jgi:hypothetical protein
MSEAQQYRERILAGELPTPMLHPLDRDYTDYTVEPESDAASPNTSVSSDDESASDASESVGDDLS